MYKRQETGGIKGLCENTQALVLMTSGSDFGKEPYSAVNFATPLLFSCFDLLGIPAEAINSFGQIQYADRANELLADSKKRIDALSKKWY